MANSTPSSTCHGPMPVRFDHSNGVVFVDGRDLDDTRGYFSFAVDTEGRVVEFHGWGARGGLDTFFPRG